MISKELAALMALRVYEQGINIPDNFPEFPYQDWVKIDISLPVTDGFAYGVFKNGNEIVISYRGTDGAAGMMGWDGASNVGLAFGSATSQAIQAAKVYAKVLELYPANPQGSNISFTGHSLGGGLAGIMSVWFNRPAIVFDPAPFQSTALSYQAVVDVMGALGVQTPQALSAYFAIGYPTPSVSVPQVFNARQIYFYANVVNEFFSRELAVGRHFAEGEFLDELLVYPSTGIYSASDNTRYTFGNQAGEVGKFAMHSQALLAAGILSDTFRQSTVNLQRSLPIIMSKEFYSKEPDGSTERNFILDLIRSEQKNPDDSKLTHIAIDFSYLGTNQNLAGLNKAAQDAIIAQGIEWYYWNQAFAEAGKKQFFKLDSPDGLLQYTTARGETTGPLTSAFSGAESRSNTYVTKWLTDFFEREQRLNDTRNAQTINPDDYAQWNIATSVVLDGRAVDDTQRQIFIGRVGIDKFTGSSKDDALWGGSGADELFGMDGDDKLFGGEGDDKLEGGDGRDRLEGGKGKDTLKGAAGDDIYLVGNGVDRVTDDAQGEGVLLTDEGVAFTGGKEDGSNSWKSEDGKVVYVKAGANLVIVKDNDAANRTVIEAFDFDMAKTGTYLGIHLADKSESPPPPPPPPSPPGGPGGGGDTDSGITWFRRGDPLVLDLDGDGVEINLSTNAVLFDDNADGRKTGTQWAKADDGMLVRDLNGNGTIDSGRELFGDQTLLPNGSLANNGFLALSALDKDADGLADGIFNSSDVAHADLKIWRDLNQDGKSQANELHTLAQAGVGSISLPAGGLHVSTFVKTTISTDANGDTSSVQTTQAVRNVFLAGNTYYREYTDNPAVTTEAAALPQMRGSGQVRDLREAMSLGTPEAAKLQQELVAFKGLTGAVERQANIFKVVQAWADTSALQEATARNPWSASQSYDWNYRTPAYAIHQYAFTEQYRRLTILERFGDRQMIERYVRTNQSAYWNPSRNQWVGYTWHSVSVEGERMVFFDRAYETIKETVYKTVYLQTEGKALLDLVDLMVDDNGLRSNFAALDAVLATRAQADPASAAVNLAEFIHFAGDSLQGSAWDGAAQLADLMEATNFTVDQTSALAYLDYKVFGDANSTSNTIYVRSTNANEGLVGRAGDDYLYGGGGNDVLIGGAGNDQLVGGSGDDQLAGGTGNDYLDGQWGSDTYFRGSGQGGSERAISKFCVRRRAQKGQAGCRWQRSAMNKIVPKLGMKYQKTNQFDKNIKKSALKSRTCSGVCYE